MRYTETTDDSAVSPVIGVILMVAITVILAAVIGTFVLGLGENVEGTTSAGVAIEQTAGQSFTVTIVDTGNLDTSAIVGPDGARSAAGSTDDILAAGSTVRVADNQAWSREPALGNPDPWGGAAATASFGFVLTNNGTKASNSNVFANASQLAAGVAGINPDNTVLLEDADERDALAAAITANSGNECYISHNANVVSGVQVNKAGIGCSGLAFAGNAALSDAGAQPVPQIADPAEAGAISPGSAITYEADAEYSFVGTVDGSENVVQTFTTEDG